jgi:hypothetical protein
MSAVSPERGIESLLHLRFGAGGDVAHYLGGGWSAEDQGR